MATKTGDTDNNGTDSGNGSKLRQIPVHNASIGPLAEGKKLTLGASVTPGLYDALCEWSGARYGVRLINGVEFQKADMFSQACREAIALGIGYPYNLAAELNPGKPSEGTAVTKRASGVVTNMFATLRRNNYDYALAAELASGAYAAASDGGKLTDAELMALWEAAA